MSSRNRTPKLRSNNNRHKPTASTPRLARQSRAKTADGLSIIRDVLILVLLLVVIMLSVSLYDHFAETKLTGKIGWRIASWLIEWIGASASFILVPLTLFSGLELLLPIRTNWRAKLTWFLFISFLFIPLILGLLPNLDGGGMIGKLCSDYAISNIGVWGYGLILICLYLIGVTFALGNQWVAPVLYSAHEASATGFDAVKKGAGFTGKAVASGIKKVNENITDLHSKWAEEREQRTEQLRKKVEERQRQIDGLEPEPIVIKPLTTLSDDEEIPNITPTVDLLHQKPDDSKSDNQLVTFDEQKTNSETHNQTDRKIATGDFGVNPEKALVFEKSKDPREFAESLFSGRSYTLPSIDMLAEAPSSTSKPGDLQERAFIIESTLKSFGIPSQVIHIQEGPRVTRFELTIGRGVNVSKVHNLSDNLALDLAVGSVRIEAPIPGKSAIGIEVPNIQSKLITVRSVLIDAQREFGQDPLVVALGKDIAGKSVSGNLGKFPHLLIAGSTGSGKSVCINALIISLLMRSHPDQLRMILVDPKYVELTQYRDIPHLLCPVLTEVKEVQAALNWTVAEMTRRYKIFAEVGARKLDDFNDLVEDTDRMPYIVMIIDELADLMMMAGPVIEKLICRIAQKARATGIHLVLATQRPDVKVITGTIKANIPSRIAFATVSQVDSRTILDGVGAEKLLGSGDMLYHPVGAPKAIRVQGCYVSDREIDAVTEFIRKQAPPDYDDDVLSALENALANDEVWDAANPDDVDDYYNEAKNIMINAKRPSISLLQRRLGIGYNRAARIMEQLEAHGIVTGPDSRGDRKLAE